MAGRPIPQRKLIPILQTVCQMSFTLFSEHTGTLVQVLPFFLVYVSTIYLEASKRGANMVGGLYLALVPPPLASK